MLKQLIFLYFLCSSALANAQSYNKEYDQHISMAHFFDVLKNYASSTTEYSKAFASTGGNGRQDDFYNASCAWALLNVTDSSFFYLDKLVHKYHYRKFDKLLKDTSFFALYDQPRWDALLMDVQNNYVQWEVKLDKILMKHLDSIFESNAEVKRRCDKMYNEHGYDSPQMRALLHETNRIDSINLAKITYILDHQGWLSANVVGDKGNAVLFQIIDKADLRTQEKYLSMMRVAAHDGDLSKMLLAKIVDRVEMLNDRPQVYGTQIGYNNGKAFLYPVRDEKNVDTRRLAVGLRPLAEFLLAYSIIYQAPAE